MSSDRVMAIAGLNVFYGQVQAVRDLRLEIEPGRLTTLIGSNGAGKTTVLNTVTGLCSPRSGSIRFLDQEISGLPVDEIVRRGISLVPEGRRLFSTMSVRENLIIGAYLRDDPAVVRRDLEKVLTYFPDLKPKLEVVVESLSGGQQQMVAVGRALMAEPKLLMLDEPTIGLAPNLVRTIAEIIRAICADGVEVLLIEQNASMALDLADDAYVLENGAVVMEGPAKRLLNDEGIKRAYLGA